MAELEATLNVEELEEWQAYHFFEPFGAPAEDDRWRLQYMLFHSANFKHDPDITWLDRDPETTKAARERQHRATLDDRILALLGSRIVSGEAEGEAVEAEADTTVATQAEPVDAEPVEATPVEKPRPRKTRKRTK